MTALGLNLLFQQSFAKMRKMWTARIFFTLSICFDEERSSLSNSRMMILSPYRLSILILQTQCPKNLSYLDWLYMIMASDNIFCASISLTHNNIPWIDEEANAAKFVAEDE